MIAMEMGAPDPISDDEIAEAAAEQARLAEPAAVAPVIVARSARTGRHAADAGRQRRFNRLHRRRPPPHLRPRRPWKCRSARASSRAACCESRSRAANDPLAPIRRMSQAEKIAFFS